MNFLFRVFFENTPQNRGVNLSEPRVNLSEPNFLGFTRLVERVNREPRFFRKIFFRSELFEKTVFSRFTPFSLCNPHKTSIVWFTLVHYLVHSVHPSIHTSNNKR